jgi:hypothetical protein
VHHPNHETRMNTFERMTNRAIVSGAMLLAACSGSYSNSTAPTTTDTVTPSIAGNWVIASLVQGTEDKTSQYSGYTLSFTETSAESGTVTATRNNSTVSGTWSHSAGVTYYGSTSTESIVLNLGTATPFDKITGTWNVTSSTDTELSLASPEVAEATQLVLMKQ